MVARALLQVILLLNVLCLLLVTWLQSSMPTLESAFTPSSLGIALAVVVLSMGATMLVGIPEPSGSSIILFTFKFQLYSFELIVWSAVVGMSIGIHFKTSLMVTILVLPWVLATLTIWSFAILFYPALVYVTQNWSTHFPAQTMFSTVVVAGTLSLMLTVLGLLTTHVTTLLGEITIIWGEVTALLKTLLATLFGHVTVRVLPRGGSAEQVPLVTLAETSTLESYEKVLILC
ncbi:hypothetical protein D9757_013379 [Collybiopsis confluens]|uniref:Uncharacterized protein n=1 Tax=Collybiopsis confluens TaxID=2823264 RepID=A0A8H5CPA7_9AGAR|nr:hypothetical protein D9757_013379 [Collybiopsis confluens]